MTVRRSFSDQAAGLTALERITWENQFVHRLGQTLGLAGLTVFGVPRPELDLSNPAAPRGYLTESIRAEPPPLPAAGASFVLRTAPWRGSIWVVRTGRVAERVR